MIYGNIWKYFFSLIILPMRFINLERSKIPLKGPYVGCKAFLGAHRGLCGTIHMAVSSVLQQA